MVNQRDSLGRKQGTGAADRRSCTWEVPGVGKNCVPGELRGGAGRRAVETAGDTCTVEEALRNKVSMRHQGTGRRRLLLQTGDGSNGGRETGLMSSDSSTGSSNEQWAAVCGDGLGVG